MQHQWRRLGKRKDTMKLSLPPKLVEKLVWVPAVISFCKIFIPSYGFDALLCRNWPFSPPNRLTLRTTLLFFPIFKLFNALEVQQMIFSNPIFLALDFNHFLSWIFHLCPTHISSHNLLFALNFVAPTYQELKISFLSVSSIVLFS